ncbi:MAG TPA: hypothetical protein VGR35_03785 [Tepidisphaeraceae bacterium]|nr:hypothetical protein [Tepidisphaeraceae bacterium]
MAVPGKRIRAIKWIAGDRCAVRVEVEEVVPDFDPSEPVLEPAVELLDEVQRLANEGKLDELARYGDVYVRRSA